MLKLQASLLMAIPLLLPSALLAMNITTAQGALLYDANYSGGGPSSHPTNDPGQWVPNITQFNSGATASAEITRLYPYSGDIEMQCTGPSDCVYSGSGKNVFVFYNSPPAAGQASVAAYRTAFPHATILAIIDGATGSSLLQALNYSDVGTQTADLMASKFVLIRTWMAYSWI